MECKKKKNWLGGGCRDRGCQKAKPRIGGTKGANSIAIKAKLVTNLLHRTQRCQH